MLKLGKPAESQRIVLRPAQGAAGEPGYEPEAGVVASPITPAIRRRALRATRLFLEEAEATSFEDMNPDQLGDMGETVSRELIRMGLADWFGIGDDDGKPLELTPDQATRIRTANDKDRPTGTIDLLLADETWFAKLEAEYVQPDALRRMEKNGLSGSPNGIGTAATPGNATANLAARPKRRAAAKAARTAKTSCKAKPRKASGKS